MTLTPRVSVIMPAFNAEEYIAEAIVSILNQSFEDFEFIIVDDESTDATEKIIESFDDQRIVALRIEHGGLVAALNHGFAHAKGEYIARMDADDRALSDRFRIQVAHLDNYPDSDVLCSDIYVINGNGFRSGTQVQSGFNNALLRESLLNRRTIKPIIHPSVMMRREVLEQLGGYRKFDSAEDHDFWLRAIDKFKFARVGQCLLEYRIHGGGVSRTKGEIQAVASAMSAVCYLIDKQIGIDIFTESPDDFSRLSKDMADKLRQRVLNSKFAFRNARLDMLCGSKLRGLWRIAGVLTRYGANALPSRSDAITAALISELVEHYCKLREIAGVGSGGV